MSEQRLTVYTETNKHGKWIFVDNGGGSLDEYEFETREEARAAARQIWPANSVWKGRPDGNDWSIVIS